VDGLVSGITKSSQLSEQEVRHLNKGVTWVKPFLCEALASDRYSTWRNIVPQCRRRQHFHTEVLTHPTATPYHPKSSTRFYKHRLSQALQDIWVLYFSL